MQKQINTIKRLKNKKSLGKLIVTTANITYYLGERGGSYRYFNSLILLHQLENKFKTRYHV